MTERPSRPFPLHRGTHAEALAVGRGPVSNLEQCYCAGPCRRARDLDAIERVSYIGRIARRQLEDQQPSSRWVGAGGSAASDDISGWLGEHRLARWLDHHGLPCG